MHHITPCIHIALQPLNKQCCNLIWDSPAAFESERTLYKCFDYVYIHDKIKMYLCILNHVYIQDDYIYIQDNFVYMQVICIHVYLNMYTCKMIMFTCKTLCTFSHTAKYFHAIGIKHMQWCPLKATVGQRWIPFDVFCYLLLKNGWTNSTVTGDFGHHNVHVI